MLREIAAGRLGPWGFVRRGWLPTRGHSVCHRRPIDGRLTGITLRNCKDQFHGLNSRWKGYTRPGNKEQHEAGGPGTRGQVSCHCFQRCTFRGGSAKVIPLQSRYDSYIEEETNVQPQPVLVPVSSQTRVKYVWVGTLKSSHKRSRSQSDDGARSCLKNAHS